MILMEVKLENRSPSKLSIKEEALPNASDRIANPNSIATSSYNQVCASVDPRLKCTTWSMINFPTYKILTGIAERTILISAVAAVRKGLVFHTSLKNDGRLP